MNNASDNDYWPLDGGCNSGFDMNWSGRGQGSGKAVVMARELVRVITVALAGSDDRSTMVWQAVFIPGNGFFPGVTGHLQDGGVHTQDHLCVN